MNKPKRNRYMVASPFWRNDRRYVPGCKHRGHIELTADEAAPLQRMQLIAEPESTQSIQSTESAQSAQGAGNTTESNSNGTGAGGDGPGTDATTDGNTNTTAMPGDVATDGSGDSQEPAFVTAVRQLTPGDASHWTNAGAPDVRALAEAGFDCTAAERNALWEQFKHLFAGE